MNKAHKYISLIVWIVGLIAIGMFIGSLTQGGIDAWYLTLNKSPLTPPGYVFGIVWTILYVLIGDKWLAYLAKQINTNAFCKSIIHCSTSFELELDSIILYLSSCRISFCLYSVNGIIGRPHSHENV